MNKSQFLQALKQRIKDLPKKDVEQILDYYSEMIDDRMEEGASMEQAVAKLGTPDAVALQIHANAEPSKPKKACNRPFAHRRRCSVPQIILLILAAPVWLPLLLAAAAIVLALATVAFALCLALFAIDFALGISTLIGLITAPIIALAQGTPTILLLYWGCALLGAGMAILLFFAARQLLALILQICQIPFRRRHQKRSVTL